MESLYILIPIAVIFLLLLTWIIVLEVRLRKFISGEDGKSLEGTIKQNTGDILELSKLVENNKLNIDSLENKFTKSIQGIGVVRFNPFRESGGNHSFAIALIDENDDGVIISTLYARERTNVFAKRIKSGISELELTGEEKEALQKAKQGKL